MMEIIRLLNRVIDLCAQGEYQGAETVAEYAKSEAEKLLIHIRNLEDSLNKISKNELVDGEFKVSKSELEELVSHCNLSREEKFK